MSWPLSHEFNEAVQNPQVVFSDPDLKGGETVVGATGLPLPRSGNFADVYQVRGSDGREWAVKCFTRPVVGLAERYARLSDALAKAELPFTVGFGYLAEGIRVGGVWRPVVKMEWVEGLLLNQVARENAGKPKVLTALGQMWSKLCKRLREAGIAHADIQHGNVLLVPGSRAGAYGLKLIDYDGMWVPALANTPSGESGHPSYQHPARASTRHYSPDVDRFPHLAVATALRGLAVVGPALWEKYDNGDNLLFTEGDYKTPAASAVMKDLWNSGDPTVEALVGRLAIACGKPIPQTPWLDHLAPEGDPAPLDTPTRRDAAAALGVALPVPVELPPEPKPEPAPAPLPPEPAPAAPPAPVYVVKVAPTPAPAPPEPEPEPAAAPAFEAMFATAVADRDEDRPTKKKSKPKPKRRGAEEDEEPGAKPSPVLLYAGGGVVLLAVVVVAGILIAGGKSKPTESAHKADEPKGQKDRHTDHSAPKPKTPDPVGPSKDRPGDPVVPKPKDSEPMPIVPVPVTPAREWKVDLPDSTFLGVPVLSRDGRTVAIPHTAKGDLIILDTETGATLAPPPEQFGGLVVPLDNGRFAPGVVRGATLPVWDPRDGKVVRELPAAGLPEGGQVFVSPSGKYLAATTTAADGQDTLKVKSTDPERVILDLKWARGTVYFTDDDTRVMVAESTGKVRWYKLPDETPTREWSFDPKALGTGAGIRAVSGNGEHLILWGPDPGPKGGNGLQLYRAQTGQRFGGIQMGPVLQYPPSIGRDGIRLVLHQSLGNREGALAFELLPNRPVIQLTPPAGFAGFRPVVLPDGQGYVAVVAGDNRRAAIRGKFEPGGAAPPPPASPPPAKGVESAIVGNQSDPVFRDTAPEGGYLIGLEVGLGKFGKNDVPHSLRPIYRTGDKETKGERHGPDLPNTVTLKAKDGYVVSAISVKTGAGLDGVTLTFTRLVNGKLDLKDSYDSEYAGGPGGNRTVKVGDGTPIIGIIGRTNKNGTNGLGVLTKGP
jgi:hypothetical protein